MLKRKPIPLRSLDHLLPPQYDYEYFAGAGTFRLTTDSIDYDPIAASWCADASLLAYCHGDFASAQWRRAGARSFRLFEGASTVAHVAAGAGWTCVVFRGTQVRLPAAGNTRDNLWADVLRDVRSDLDVARVPWPQGGLVHRGFYEALQQIWGDTSGGEGLCAYVARIAERQGLSRVWFTGHSLGGALAALAARAYHETGRMGGAYTYGSPRVGDRAFAESYTVPCHRIVHTSDMIAKVPPWPFRHVGQRHNIGSTESPSGPVVLASRVTDWLWRHTPVASSFADHAPLFYATHLWNACVDAPPEEI
ncbi:MAG: lipase family protein [Nitrospiraceae bacterium]